jgi:hypothetical protein
MHPEVRPGWCAFCPSDASVIHQINVPSKSVKLKGLAECISYIFVLTPKILNTLVIAFKRSFDGVAARV